jgi:hypothetical protein
MTKTYDEIREQTELNEVSLIRAGATLLFASKVKQDGMKLEQSVGKAKRKFQESKTAKTTEKKLDIMADGMTELCDAIFYKRRMIGSLTGLSLSAALTSQKTDKEFSKLLKGKSRR